MPLSTGWLAVRLATKLPEPDTGRTKNQWSRKAFMAYDAAIRNRFVSSFHASTPPTKSSIAVLLSRLFSQRPIVISGDELFRWNLALLAVS